MIGFMGSPACLAAARAFLAELDLEVLDLLLQRQHLLLLLGLLREKGPPAPCNRR